jgi:hypothetical protein
MRKLGLGIATIALLAIAAGPVLAVPAGNPHVNQWEVTCGEVTTVVLAKGVPGWNAEDGSKAMLLRGGHLTVWENGGVTLDVESVPPPGLASTLVTCRVEGPIGVDPEVFHLIYDPAYMQFTS